ncbi:MAG: BatA domain-containing protein, partial [Umezawaea sp.]
MLGLSLGAFATPWWFLLAIAVAALAVIYVVLQRMRRRRMLRFANLELLERVAPKREGWYRHVPAAFLLVAFLLLTVALAGPTAEQKVPRNRATVMLVIDVSLSMKATDIKPSRLEAAQAAAKS